MEALGFLGGRWVDGQGEAEGHRVPGEFRIDPAAGGGAFLRRDGSKVAGVAGQTAPTVEQVIVTYTEAIELCVPLSIRERSDAEHPLMRSL